MSYPPFRPWPTEPRLVGGSQPGLPHGPQPGLPVVPVLLGATLAMLAVTPALPVGVVGWLVLERTGWRARWLALAAVAALAAFLVPPWRSSWLLLHTQGWAAVAAAWPWWWARLDVWQAVLVCEAPLSVPLGVLGAVVAAQRNGARASGAPWELSTIRHHARAEAREAKRILARLDDPKAAASCSAPPLAVARDGDLAAWRQGEFAVMPRELRGRALAVAGRPGTGKTVTAGRLVAADGAAGRRVIFLDAKGTDPGLAWSTVEAWHHGAGYEPEYRLWPASALDGWRGEPEELVNRLLAGQDWSEPFYKRVAGRAVRLACSAPEGVPRSAEDLLRRLTPEGLIAAQGEDVTRAAAAERVTRERGFSGVEMRFADYFDSLRGRFDGDWSWDDGELLFLRMNTLAEPEDRAAAFGFLCADLAAWATTRKARLGDDVTIYVDEFSAVSDGAWHAIDLAERLRDVGVGVVFLAQSHEGFGPPDLRERLLASCAALVVLGMDHPEPLLAAAGTTWQQEQTWQLDHRGPTGAARLSMAEVPKVDPNAVRAAETGECWVLSSGRYLHGQVVRPSALPWPAPALRAAREAVEVVRVDDHQDGPGQALERRTAPLAVPGDPQDPQGLPAPRRALVARQLAAKVQTGELEAARELAEAFGLGLLLAAMLEASRRRRRWRP